MSGSYYEDYMRNRTLQKHSSQEGTRNLLTDRNAYISYLEVQIEKVSTACLTTQSFDKKIDTLQLNVSDLDRYVSFAQS